MSEPARVSSAPEAGEQPARVRPRPLLRGAQAIALATVFGLLALLVWRVIHQAGGSAVVAEVRAGKKPPAPAFDLPVIWYRTGNWPKPLRNTVRDGGVTLAELCGYPVVLNFWASWCAPCRDEAPRFEASAIAHGGTVAFLGVDAQDVTSDARHFLEKYGINYVSVRDSGSILGRYGVTGFPETYYLDPQGRIVAHDVGEASRSDIERGITRASEE